jgi:hypothetical protein
MSYHVIREQGYVLDSGEEQIFYRYIDPNYEHRDPATAQASWHLSGTDENEALGIRAFRNGRSVVEDVRANKEYGDLRIVELIVDRVYFVTDEQLPAIQTKALERA